MQLLVSKGDSSGHARTRDDTKPNNLSLPNELSGDHLMIGSNDDSGAKEGFVSNFMANIENENERHGTKKLTKSKSSQNFA